MILYGSTTKAISHSPGVKGVGLKSKPVAASFFRVCSLGDTICLAPFQIRLRPTVVFLRRKKVLKNDKQELARLENPRISLCTVTFGTAALLAKNSHLW
jgi:hypothetical protein